MKTRSEWYSTNELFGVCVGYYSKGNKKLSYNDLTTITERFHKNRRTQSFQDLIDALDNKVNQLELVA